MNLVAVFGYLTKTARSCEPKRLCNETKVLSHLERTPATPHAGGWDEKVEGGEGENREEKACFQSWPFVDLSGAWSGSRGSFQPGMRTSGREGRGWQTG